MCWGFPKLKLLMAYYRIYNTTFCADIAHHCQFRTANLRNLSDYSKITRIFASKNIIYSLKLEVFIARRIFKSREEGKQVSSPAVRVAIASIAIGLAVMLLSIAIIVGFKREVRSKVIGFGSHIQITALDNNASYETQPIAVSDTLIDRILSVPGVKRVEVFSTKPGIIKTRNDFLGVVLKGIDEHYDWDFFKQNIVEGSIIQILPDETTDEVIISKDIADKLHLKLDSTFVAYFVQQDVRARKFKIKGIYQTNFAEYDKIFIIADIKRVRRLNNWENDQVSGLEILVNDYNRIDPITDEVYFAVSPLQDRFGNHFFTRSIKQLNPLIFSWLGVLDMNVVIIILLMLAVSVFTMISGLLIIILERANMIGILKSLGENNRSIREIFLYISFFLIGKGLVLGNLIGLSIYFLQKYTGFLTLDPEIYYTSTVPVDLSIGNFLLLNIGTLIISMLMLIGPSYMIARISPEKTIHFE